MNTIIVRQILKSVNGDFFAAAKNIHLKYQRGVLTEDEYLDYMDILAALGMAAGWQP